MKTEKKNKQDYPFGLTQADWDAIREDAKNTILANQKDYTKIKFPPKNSTK